MLTSRLRTLERGARARDDDMATASRSETPPARRPPWRTRLASRRALSSGGGGGGSSISFRSALVLITQTETVARRSQRRAAAALAVRAALKLQPDNFSRWVLAKFSKSRGRFSSVTRQLYNFDFYK